jgi:hypothetical protein
MSFGIFFKRPSDHVFNPFSLHKSPVWKRLVAHSGERQVDDDKIARTFCDPFLKSLKWS